MAWRSFFLMRVRPAEIPVWVDWRSAAGSAMNVALPNQALSDMGLVSLLHEHRRLADPT
jgi:hypothetical protein